MTVVCDLISRFVLGDQSLYYVTLATTAAAAIFVAVGIADARREGRAGGWSRVGFELAALVLLAASFALRVASWDPNIGTPIRAMGLVVLAGVLTVLADRRPPAAAD